MVGGNESGTTALTNSASKISCATAKYVKVLGMARVSRQDKLDLLRALVAGEVDKSLQSMLQDFLVEDRCNLVQLKDILEGVD